MLKNPTTISSDCCYAIGLHLFNIVGQIMHLFDSKLRIKFRFLRHILSVCPGFQVSAQHGAWVLDVTLSTCVQCSWTSHVSLLSSSSRAARTTPSPYQPRDVIKRSSLPVQQLGSHYLTTLGTLTFRYLLLYVISRISSSLPTSTLQRRVGHRLLFVTYPDPTQDFLDPTRSISVDL